MPEKQLILFAWPYPARLRARVKIPRNTLYIEKKSTFFIVLKYLIILYSEFIHFLFGSSLL